MKTARVVIGVCFFTGLLVAQFDTSGPAPTPEPGTVLLLGAGLAGIGFVAWRRSRKR